MRTRLVGTLSGLGVLALGILSGNPAMAQAGGTEKPVLYTYVSTWAVPRAMWGDYQKNQAAEDEGMTKSVADGTLVSFGSYSVLNHQEGQATHGSWFSARSMANLMKVLEGVRSTPDATAPVLAASKHWDYILASHDYNAHSGTFKNGYLRVGTWSYKPGASDPGGKIMKATMVAELEKLFAEGALHSYQIDVERLHSADPDVFHVAIVTNGTDGIDKFDASVDDMQKDNPAGMAGYTSMLERHGHRDFLAHVDTMTHK
jgi:hypothetical protein